MKKLVIVESPAKAHTIGRFLGDDYVVKASVGHIRDLPQPSQLPASMKKGPYARFSVNVDGNFEPYYAVAADKKKTVKELKDALKSADELLLATDEDREGEAIAWHLNEVLKPKVPTKRMVFHEITPEAIQSALDHPRELDTELVDAQETRRILDRLVGYEVSPLLWRKVAAGLSAGRVQSVATRLVVDRERERMAFVPAGYWDITGTFDKNGDAFTAKLTALDGSRVAQGRDFTDRGEMTPKARRDGVRLLDEAGAEALLASIKASSASVTSVETKPYRRRPAAPFTTSTLQQEAGRKLRLSSRDTMRAAQSLYESGYITYMRTDSTHLSEEAISAARGQARELFGAEAVPDKPRFYATKSKGAQEAHEAIRPAGRHFRTPDQLRGKVTGIQLAVYELIWKRTLASQMEDARGQTLSVRIAVPVDAAGAKVAEFSASGTTITFRGFMAAYEESADAKRYKEKDDVRLPQLSEKDALAIREATADSHETLPPPRYTEASLVKKMEELGIGRPSTYASTISTIVDRGYVEKHGQALAPTWTAFSVVRLLEQNLPDLVDYDFTAEMEADLDKIAEGKENSTDYLARFWRGSGERQGLEGRVEGLGDIDARAVNSIPLGDGFTVRVGRYGPYLEKDGEERHASIPDGIAPDELTPAKAAEIFEKAASDGRELGTDPESGHVITVKTGRFGPYITEIIPEDEVALTPTGKVSKRSPKPRTASLFKSMTPETVTLEDALRLLRLPRVIGKTDDGVDVTAQNGRYGPYLKCGKDTRSLEFEEQIFSLTLEEAKEILSKPKQRRGQKPPLKELGTDPATGKPVVLKDGRFGPYVTDGTTNASLRRSDSVEELTEDRAYELLAERRAKGPAKKRTTRKTTGKSKATGKSAGKSKATGKSKTGAKKVSGKKTTGTKKAAGTKKTTSTKKATAKKPTTESAGKASTKKSASADKSTTESE